LKICSELDESSKKLLLDNESRSMAETSLKGVKHPLNMILASISMGLTPREKKFQAKVVQLTILYIMVYNMLAEGRVLG